MRAHDSDYFENTRQATFVQQEYAIRNPRDFVGYGEHCWGFTAFDAPGWCKRVVDGVEREFFDDIARGAVVQSIVLHCRIARPVGGSLRITSASIKASRADDRELPD